MDWLSLFMLILLGATAYFQTIQGLFSAMLMCVLVILSTAITLATFEWVAFSFLIGPLGDLAYPTAFMGMFLVPLISLRLAMDALIVRSTLLPVLLDRAAGATASLLTAFLMVGVLATGIQMIPFGGSFLGHKALNEETGERNSLWLNPDVFAIGFASFLSDGVFSGRQSFEEVHPDLLQEIAWVQSSAKEVRHLAPPGAIRVVRVETRDYIFDKQITKPARGRSVPAEVNYNRLNPPGGKQWYVVRLAFGTDARDDKQQIAFGRRHVRLVGHERSGGPLLNNAPVAINDNDRPNMAVKIADGKLYKPAEGTEVDFAFELPTEFIPVFIEYAHGARADMAGAKPEQVLVPQDEAAAATPPPAPPSQPAPPRQPNNDRVSGVRVTGESRFDNSLPMTMTDYQQTDLEEKGGAMVNGHVHGTVEAQIPAGKSAKLSRFEVPADKRLFHMEVEQLRARSGIGKVLSFAVTSLQNYTLKDEAGNVYPVSGQYAVAGVDGRDVIEIQYYPEAVATGNRGGMRPFQRIKAQQLDDRGTRLVFLFLVNPGARIAEFSTGRAPTDMRDLDLTAPQ